MKRQETAGIKRKSPAEKPVSLRPLKVEEALKELLKVKPIKSKVTKLGE